MAGTSGPRRLQPGQDLPSRREVTSAERRTRCARASAFGQGMQAQSECDHGLQRFLDWLS
jgi:hypothetical protein